MKYFLIFSILFFPVICLAQVGFQNSGKAMQDAVGDTYDSHVIGENQSSVDFAADVSVAPFAVALMLANYVLFFFQLIAVITTLFIIYGGFQWLTAGGNSEKVSQAQKTVTNAAIGLLVVMSAYLIIALALQLGSS